MTIDSGDVTVLGPPMAGEAAFVSVVAAVLTCGGPAVTTLLLSIAGAADSRILLSASNAD